MIPGQLVACRATSVIMIRLGLLLVLLLLLLAGCAASTDADVDWLSCPHICPVGESCDAPSTQVLTPTADGGGGGSGGANVGGSGGSAR